MTTKDGRKRIAMRRGASALIAFTLSTGSRTPRPSALGDAFGDGRGVGGAGPYEDGGGPAGCGRHLVGEARVARFGRALFDGPWARTNRGLVQIVELPAEGNASTIERLKVTVMPSVLAYTPSPDGPVCRGVKAGGSPEEVVAWLGSMGIGDPRVASATVDPSVIPANHDGYASPQQPYSPPPPVQTPPAVTYTPAYTAQPAPVAPQTYYASTPMYTQAPVAAPTASYVQLPGPNVVVQQGQPQVFVTQAAPAPAYAPQLMPATGNMYLPAPSAPAALPQVAMTTPAVAMAPPAAAYVAPAAPVAAPASTAMATVTNQTMGLPTTGSRTRIRVKGPGPLCTVLAHLGEKMVTLGRARIEMVHETDLNTPSIQGGGNVATLTTTMPPRSSRRSRT